ncbi:MAG: flagellar basal body-associated FliL family protein [Candidatus Hydrogenedentes bacterium]|nr:flagellar basal body-associated FliL family protein [Candidatus Hydrogenedentota bacterium]
MAEPKDDQKAAKGKSSLTPILIGVVAVLGAVVVAVVVFNFVLRPRLTDTPKPAEAEEEKHESKIPATAVTVPFDEAFTTVIMPSPDMPASTLLYKVSLECSNQAAAEKVKANMARFTAIIRKMHSYKSRQELDDPFVEQSIEKQIQQEANRILKELPVPAPTGGGEGGGHGGGESAAPAESDGGEERITAVFHEKFFVQDM